MIANHKNGRYNKLLPVGLLKAIKGKIISVENPITHEVHYEGTGKVVFDIKDKKGAWGVIRIRTEN